MLLTKLSMYPKASNSASDRVIPIFGGIVLVLILFFPPILFGGREPAVEFLDLLLPVLAIIVFLKRKEIEPKRFYYLVFTFVFFILLSIIINSRLTVIVDHFEIFKVLKFLTVVALFSFIGWDYFFKYWIKPLFVILVIFNLFQYYNVFHINSFLENVYLGKTRYSTFGLDSIGLPTNKRMIGFTSNPNINAIVFMFFVVVFIPKKDSSYKTFIWFSVALTMMLLCQSRTAMLAMVPLLLTHAFIIRKDLKKLISLFLLALSCFLISLFITKISVGVEFIPKSNSDAVESVVEEEQHYTYLEGVIHGEVLNTSSMEGRYVVWEHLWSMIKEKPLFGYSPYKEYFYKNGIYSENEFIMMIWRYGFIGGLIYISILLSLFVLAIKNLTSAAGINMLLFLIVIVVTSLTNNPFANKTIVVLFAILIGLLFSEIRRKKLDPNHESGNSSC